MLVQVLAVQTLGLNCNKGKLSIREKERLNYPKIYIKIQILPGALPNKLPVAGAGAPKAGAGAGCPKAGAKL
jgi:hypothetical protein